MRTFLLRVVPSLLLFVGCQAEQAEEVTDDSGGAGGNGGSDTTESSGGAANLTMGGNSATGGSVGTAVTGGRIGGIDAGAAGATAAMTADAGGLDSGAVVVVEDIPPAGWKKTVMAAGYGGMRVVTQDQGATWKKVAQLTRGGGDDSELLRGVTYGKGVWVAAGWRMFTSTDGSTWKEGKNPSGCGLVGGLAYGNGVFVATCGEDSFVSSDGFTWKKGGRVGTTTGHTYVVFAKGRFASSGDNGASYVSTDGIKWSNLNGVNKVRYCLDDLHSQSACAGQGWFSQMYYQGTWRGNIEHAADGRSWKRTYTDEWENSVNAFGEGYMPPLN